MHKRLLGLLVLFLMSTMYFVYYFQVSRQPNVYLIKTIKNEPPKEVFIETEIELTKMKIDRVIIKEARFPASVPNEKVQ